MGEVTAQDITVEICDDGKARITWPVGWLLTRHSAVLPAKVAEALIDPDRARANGVTVTVSTPEEATVEQREAETFIPR